MPFFILVVFPAPRSLSEGISHHYETAVNDIPAQKQNLMIAGPPLF
jgi:hypothetical protein